MRALYNYLLNCTIQELIIAVLYGACIVGFLRWLITKEK